MNVSELKYLKGGLKMKSENNSKKEMPKSLKCNSNSHVDPNSENTYSNLNEGIIYEEVAKNYYNKQSNNPQNKESYWPYVALTFIIFIGGGTFFLPNKIFCSPIMQFFLSLILLALAVWGMGGDKNCNRTSYMFSGTSIIWLTLIACYISSKYEFKVLSQVRYKPSLEEFRLTSLLILLLLLLFFIEFWTELYKEKNKEKMSKSIDVILKKYVKEEENQLIAIDMLLNRSKNFSVGIERELKNSIITKIFHLSNVTLIASFVMIGFICRNLISPIEVDPANITSSVDNFFSTVNSEIIKEVFLLIKYCCFISLYVFDIFFGLYKYSRRFLELYKEVLKDKQFTLSFGKLHALDKEELIL